MDDSPMIATGQRWLSKHDPSGPYNALDIIDDAGPDLTVQWVDSGERATITRDELRRRFRPD